MKMKKERAFLILIGGGTGSGKTTVAKMIKKASGKKNILMISLDNYYKGWGHLPPREREKINFDHPDTIEWSLLKEHLRKLLNGEPIEMPLYSYKIHARVGYQVVKPKKIIILEGIFALYSAEINSMAQLRIFVDTDPDVRLIRRLQRDIKERKRTIESILKQWLEKVKPMHDKFVEPTKKNAHIIVPEDPDGKMRGVAIELIKTKIRHWLKK